MPKPSSIGIIFLLVSVAFFAVLGATMATDTVEEAAVQSAEPTNDVVITAEDEYVDDTLVVDESTIIISEDPFEDDPTVPKRASSRDMPHRAAEVPDQSSFIIARGVPGTRGVMNTTTLMTITDIPSKTHYMETFDVGGQLYEDNNSDGNPNSGDLPIPMAMMHYYWDPGSPFYQEDYFITQHDPGDADPNQNSSAGEWNFSITVDETRIGECELEVEFKGQWTENGSYYWELNDSEPLRALTILTNQIYNYDDDGDGPKDEENFNGQDDDGDTRIDEDTQAFIARYGCTQKMFIDLWHETAITSAVDKSIVPIGDTITVSGTIADDSVVDPDTQEPLMSMGYKTVRVFFGGQYVGETIATQKPGEMVSRFSFTYQIPMGTKAGRHAVEVSFDPSYNVTLNNFYEPVNITRYVKVQRFSDVVFDDIGTDAWVYHGKRIQINGSIIDKYKYSLEKTKVGPNLIVDSESFHARYKYYVHWGRPTDSFYKRYGPFFVNNTNGSFSINVDISASSIQTLGPVNVSCEFFITEAYWQIGGTTVLDQGKLFYYRPSTNYTTYVVRAHTELELYLDQDNNGVYNEPDEFITRVPYVDNEGKTHYYNIARIRGLLKDVEASSPNNPVPVTNHDIVFYWGYGEVSVREFITTTDTQGRFSIDVPIQMDQALGPVTILAKYTNPNPAEQYYDSCSFFDNDGEPFSVVAMTHLHVQTPVISTFKGETVYIKGSLIDDMNSFVKNRTVKIYWLSRSGESLGEPIGTINTDSMGRFTFTDYEVPITQPVGAAYVVAKFDGSPQWPDGPAGKKYSPKDAYANANSPEVMYNISAYTTLQLDPLAGTLVRNQEFSVTGALYEMYKGERTTEAVKKVDIDVFLENAGETYRIGTTTTSGDGTTDGHFIFSGKVPKSLYIGQVTVRVQFNGTSRYAQSQNATSTQLWANTYIRVLLKPPADEDNRLIIEEETITAESELIFNMKVFERDTPDDEEPRPVQFGVVWLNISSAAGHQAFHNNSIAYTNEFGRVMFNFSRPMRDSDFGLKLPADKETELIINLTYIGGPNLKSSYQTYKAVYKPTPPPPPTPLMERDIAGLLLWHWILIILALIIISAIIIFFAYRYYRKRARIRGMKKIIKRAADQLVAGNEYTAVIFKSYQKLGAHLRKYGYLRRDSETFREFEDAIRVALPIDHDSMDNFLELLEEARYSQHKIGEEQRNAAISNLRNIEKSLEKIILDEEAAMRALESLETEDYSETEIVVGAGETPKGGAPPAPPAGGAPPPAGPPGPDGPK